MKVTVMIPTYNRVKLVTELVERLKELKPDCHIVVVDDGTKEDYTVGDTFFKFAVNNGKKGWWKNINKLFELALDTDADCYRRS